MRKKFISKRWIAFFIYPILFLFIVILSLPVFSRYLRKTKQVKASILLVEGWVSPIVIEKAYNEFIDNDYSQIITTGLGVTDYYPVVMNGYLTFYTDSILNEYKIKETHNIGATLYSEMDGEHCAHFNLYINDSLINDFCAGKKKKKYEVNYYGSLDQIDSVMVYFDNDSMGDFGDHNLYVKEIIIDNQIKISYKNNSLYDRTANGWEKRILNNYSTYAGLAKKRLIEMGIPETKIISVPAYNQMGNRTLSSALAFRDWLYETDFQVNGINIISVGPHARRTWMTYNKILDKFCEIGIISFPEDDNTLKTQIEKSFNILKELSGVFYYWFILLFY